MLWALVVFGWDTHLEQEVYCLILVQGSFSLSESDSFSLKCICRSLLPLRVDFSGCTASLGNFLTMDNLRKCRLIVMEWCSMIKGSGKSVNHLLLHCEVAGELWDVHRWCHSSFCLLEGLLGKLHFCCYMENVPLCLLVWCIWLKRNDQSLEDRECSFNELRGFFFPTLFLWASVIVRSTIHDFLILFASA